MNQGDQFENGPGKWGWRNLLVINASIAIALFLVIFVGYETWRVGRSVPAKRDSVARSTVDRDRFNVVLYVIDTLRADYVHAYGSRRSITPSIDRLAREGVLFENHSSAAPWTLPSVATLLTGTPVCTHGVTLDGHKLPASIPTLAQMLREAGWRTASFYANPFAGPASGLVRGFDSHGLLISGDTNKPSQWLDRELDHSAFLYVHTIEPHDPYRVPERFRGMAESISADELKRVNGLIAEFRQLSRFDFAAKKPIGSSDKTAEIDAVLSQLKSARDTIRELYSVQVAWADDNLGQIIHHLEKRGMWDNTLFILTADHGEEFAEHGMWQHDQSAYEELLHTPLIIKFPKREFAGTRVSQPVSAVDVLPTVLDYLGESERQAAGSGTSLIPLARGGSQPRGMLLASIRHNMKKFYRPSKERRGDVNVVVRDGRWKAIWNVEPKSVELFDLEADPGELCNLANDEVERAARMVAFATDEYKACIDQAAAGDRPQVETIDERSRETLRQLGYVGTSSGSDE